MTDEDEQWAELDEDTVAVFAAIMEATCADCLDPRPVRLCHDTFYCLEHFERHCALFHRNVSHGA